MNTITDTTRQVKQIISFELTSTENKDLFKYEDVVYGYYPYSLRLADQIYPDMICIECRVDLDINLGNSALLESALVICYHINTKYVENLKSKIFEIGFDAHKEFVRAFKERIYSIGVSPSYTPAFDLQQYESKVTTFLRKDIGY